MDIPRYFQPVNLPTELSDAQINVKKKKKKEREGQYKI